MRSPPVTAEETGSARNYLSGVFSLGVATQDGLPGNSPLRLSIACRKIISKPIASEFGHSQPPTCSPQRAEIFRLSQRPNRNRRRPRPDRRASGSIRVASDGIRRERQRTSVRQASWFRRTTAPIRVCCAALLFVTIAAATLVAKNPPTHKIDINSASAKELQELPGVGPTTAKAIIQFRTKSGSFRRVEDLLAIRVISETKLAKMRPYITVARRHRRRNLRPCLHRHINGS